MVTKYNYPPGSHKKFFKTLNDRTMEYIEQQHVLIETLEEATNLGIHHDNLFASRTAHDMATNEMKADFCLQYLADYPNKIKINAEELETVINNTEKILKLIDEIKTSQWEVLKRKLTIWDILINLNDNYTKNKQLEAMLNE